MLKNVFFPQKKILFFNINKLLLNKISSNVRDYIRVFDKIIIDKKLIKL